ncbi:MAG TPA: NAD-dependent epimerase/dehydratase family protein [Gaiellaceae bacterium]|nr:NAD-dependent epimerase/dehydratase family protein [Gaiellaceae bacterium]
MRLLILGGTKFLGRAIADAALERGHELTLFTRGQTSPDLYPQAERLRGDRDGALAALAGRSWDAVVDTSGYVPRVVRASAELLTGAAAHYAFVSSVSVYRDFAEPVREESTLATVEDETTEDVQEHYGALKALCERVVEEVFPGRALVVRAGLIVGPYDPTDRFTYWPLRVARGGEVLVPGDPERLIQCVDVRDLADWIVRAVEQRLAGVFNATGPERRPTMRGLVATCRSAAGSDASFTFVDDAFLVEREVGEWLELPLWIAEAPEWSHFMDADVSRAVAAGLAFRPLAETVCDTLSWARARGARESAPGTDGTKGVGLEPERERSLLEEWHAQYG